MKRKKYLVIPFILLFIGLISVTFGIVLDYTKILGTINSKQIVGDIYMHYTSGSEININMLPRSTRPDEYFEFTVSGKNTSKRTVEYNVILEYGNNINGKTRIKDSALMFTLVEVKDNVETIVVENQSYSSINNQSIYAGYIDSNTTEDIEISYKLYVWIGENVLIGNVSEADYSIEEWNNVYANLKVKVNGSIAIDSSSILANLNNSNSILEDGIYYISGSSGYIDFNYLWYSGRMWRITAIYPDGSMKLVTNKTITNIQFDSSGSVNYYTDENNNSTIYQYLNNDFLSTLYNYEKFLDTTKYWNATMTSAYTEKPLETTMISSAISPVGLLNSYEYYKSNQNTTYSNGGYLNIGYLHWWLLNPYSSSVVWDVNINGYGSNNSPNGEYGARPSIIIKSGITLSGNGTIENPYKLKDDKKEDETSLLYKIKYKNDTNCKTYVEEDGITYISGTKDCIDFNYVWWSGKMWRITAIYPDGAMKMVTDNMITSIAFGENVTYYDKTNGTKSHMFQWLNEDFRDTLYNKGADIVDTTKYWNATMMLSNSTISTKPEETDATMIPTTISPIGLLNYYEYYKSYQNTTNSNGYLNIGYDWWLLNNYSSSNAWVVNSSGNTQIAFMSGLRPSIYLKSGIMLSGNGTKDSPYRIADDYDRANVNDNLYTRHSGEYIKFDTDGVSGNYDDAPLFRIVVVEGEGNTRKTKIVAMDYAANKTTKKFASTTIFGASGNTQSNDYWDYYLNNDWYDSLSFKDKIEISTYYIGIVEAPYNYKSTVCRLVGSYTTNECLNNESLRVATKFVGNVGLLRYGEMFATQQGKNFKSSMNMWLISRFYNSYVANVYNQGSIIEDKVPTENLAVRPSYYLKSTVKILSGSGTELDPYIVS